MIPGPARSCAGTLAQAARRLARHPIPVGMVLLGVAGGLLPGPAGLAGHIRAGVIAAFAFAGLSGVAVGLVQAVRARLAIALLPHPAPPHDMAAALSQAEALLASIQPWPETVRAADPAVTEVRWDTGRAHDGRDLDPARVTKMRIICRRFRQEAVAAGVLHQMPQILLIADDGAVIRLFGSAWPDSTGVAGLIPAESIPAAAQ
jgi:hypothetical protein